MSHELPRSLQDAVSVLLGVCLTAARDDEAVAHALRVVSGQISDQLGTLGAPRDTSPRPQASKDGGTAGHAVLTPTGRRRSPSESGAGSEAKEEDTKRIAGPLAIVVTRARWKAAACRLAITRVDNLSAPADAQEERAAQAATRERSLRSRLGELPDTSAWMLDSPFGKRVSEQDAFKVDPAAVKRMGDIADCYETVAAGAEIAMDLDESGVFRGGPPATFLYLLAEAQSALLHSLNEAPTRIDSDQRDVFLWLKEQTTRYRIYVDRHMRLDDPAEVTGSADLLERLKRSARDAQEQRSLRRERGQVLSKVRYHVGKLLSEDQPLESEVSSLEAALGRWRDLPAEPRSQRNLVEVLKPLAEKAGSFPDSSSATEELLEILAAVGFQTERSGTQDSGDGTKDHVVTPMGGESRPKGAQGQAAADPKAEQKAKEQLEEVAKLLADKAVAVIVDPGVEVDLGALQRDLTPRDLSLHVVDVQSTEEDRWVKLNGLLDSEDVEVVLLGVRLSADEYQQFKERCLERKKPFVRLPGSFSPGAVAHQIARQVGWRLRGQPSRGE